MMMKTSCAGIILKPAIIEKKQMISDRNWKSAQIHD